MRNRTINILGETWKLVFDEKLNNQWGVCDYTVRTIKICPSMTEPKIPDDRLIDMELHSHKVLRHEIIHAMITEGGMRNKDKWKDEDMIDWISLQYPKMQKLFEELGIEE